MNIAELNAASEGEARAALLRCCGAARFVDGMLARRPFADQAALLDAARAVGASLGDDDWREAFTHHPRIGDLRSLRAKYAATATWAEGEQAAAAMANEQVLTGLAVGNLAYEARFGHIFIVCATGKSAPEMLALLRARMNNPPAVELGIAAGEQEKITLLRLEKLLEATP
ncbi:MAG: 2-oxo-4-hydroxy-4-carboxy-5-ureidoimidazoline decarboxylase [Myxococcales bacterium]|nr:2-oxo-4-hydroxy-4-carboxy-5-ureidoimidazoline decarboxylase [Myxococcales bacterium]